MTHQDDQALQATIMDKLNDPGVGAHGVTVSVGKGAVRLSGNMTSLAEKLAAVRSVLRISGVRAVADDMTVQNSGSSDAAIAEAARQMLCGATDVPADAVMVAVSGHVITLSGKVMRQSQRDAAARAVANLRGVIAVTNQIRLEQPFSDVLSP